MAEEQRKIWKLVMTGGPCGGKTTGQTRLATFFKNLGWKVYRVPETANILLSGGVNFAELDDEAAERFQVSDYILCKVWSEKKFTNSVPILLLIKVSRILNFFPEFLDIRCAYIMSKGPPKIRKIDRVESLNKTT